MTAKQIEDAAVKLPKRDRERLARKLLDTLFVKPEARMPRYSRMDEEASAAIDT